MSSASVSSRRPCDSPCEFVYPRVWCSCSFTIRTRTEVEICDVAGNLGKLCYVCPRCRLFRGWLVPFAASQDMADIEQGYQPNTGVNSSSPLCYRGARCRRVQCRNDASIKISASSENPGKLYYICESCKLFVAWCLPMKSETQVLHLQPIGTNANNREAGATVYTVDDIGRLLYKLVIVNLFIFLLLVIVLMLVVVVR